MDCLPRIVHYMNAAVFCLVIAHVHNGSNWKTPLPLEKIESHSCKGLVESTFLTADSGAGPLDGPAIDDLQRRKSAMSGSDTTAATYLAKVAQDKSDIAGSRPEMFTILKDEEAKSRGVEMITRDRTYNPQKEDSSYKPKVSTWGVFPRPADISQAYGGGRTIRPGDVRPWIFSTTRQEY